MSTPLSCRGMEWGPCGNKSLVLTRREVEVKVLNTLTMVVDGIGVDFTPNKVGLVMNHFVAVEGYAQVATMCLCRSCLARRPRMTREHTLSIHAMTVGTRSQPCSRRFLANSKYAPASVGKSVKKARAYSITVRVNSWWDICRSGWKTGGPTSSGTRRVRLRGLGIVTATKSY